MAYETEQGNLIRIGNDISAEISPNFAASTVGMNLVTVQQFSPEINVIKFRKAGSLTAAAVSESGSWSYGSGSELTDSSVTVTGAKVAQNAKVTVEALRFGAGQADFARVAAEQGRALARSYDDSLCALFPSLSQSVTATSTLTRDELLDAMQLIDAGNVPSGTLVAMLHAKQISDLRKELSNDNGTPWSNISLLDILGGRPQATGFAGNYAGIDLFQSNLVDNSGGNHQGALFHPEYTFCSGVGGSFETNVQYEADDFLYKISSHFFYDVKEWNDGAGILVLSDT